MEEATSRGVHPRWPMPLCTMDCAPKAMEVYAAKREAMAAYCSSLGREGGMSSPRSFFSQPSICTCSASSS